MRCPLCKETIQDEAVLCRFCGARKRGEEWDPPSLLAPKPPGPAKPTGELTLRGSGAMFLLSALFEMSSPRDPIPLLGAMRGDGVALVYHVAFAAVYVWMGLGLLQLRPWGPRAVYIGTALYSIDSVRWILDRHVLVASSSELSDLAELTGGAIDKNSIQQGMVFEAVLLLLLWWGFAVYVYVRRAAFTGPKAS